MWKFYTLIRKVYTFICTKFILSLYSVSVTKWFLHVTYLTLVTCQDVSNGCRFFEAKVGLFGQLWAFFQPFSWIISTYFLIARHMLSLLGQVITFDHCPTVGRQFVIFVVGRSTFWHLKFFLWANLTISLMDDRPYTYSVKHQPTVHRSIAGDQADDPMLETYLG